MAIVMISHANFSDDEPVAKLVHNLLQDAISKNASDIHLEPYQYFSRIRFRQDGILHEITTIANHLANRITSRLKILAELNIAERRLPQDGRLQVETHPPIDIRISTCPSLHGEKITLRLLKKQSDHLNLHDLGLSTKQLQILITKLTQPQGIILITGPTGSGKSTTLYSSLQYLNRIEKNIVTIEDPIEIEIPGITQVNVNPHIGLTFARILRTFLRQDPDIIMIGEIRDTKTARMAIQAATTGHLVLSTLHTNNTIEAITRLQSLGIATHEFINSISLIIAQRLIRKLCTQCRRISQANSPSVHSYLPIKHYQATGCNLCYLGYKDRIGIFELLPITRKIAHYFSVNKDVLQLIKLIKAENIPSLWHSALTKVNDGQTSYVEITRILNKPEYEYS